MRLWQLNWVQISWVKVLYSLLLLELFYMNITGTSALSIVGTIFNVLILIDLQIKKKPKKVLKELKFRL